jgi:hypothetical protein
MDKVYIYYNDETKYQRPTIVHLNCEFSHSKEIEIRLNDFKCRFCQANCKHNLQSILIYFDSKYIGSVSCHLNSEIRLNHLVKNNMINFMDESEFKIFVNQYREYIK